MTRVNDSAATKNSRLSTIHIKKILVQTCLINDKILSYSHIDTIFDMTTLLCLMIVISGVHVPRVFESTLCSKQNYPFVHTIFFLKAF